MIDAQVQPGIGRHVARHQRTCHFDNRVDVGHARNAETDPLAADRIDAGVRVMQAQAGRAQQPGECGMDACLGLPCRNRNRQQLGNAQRIGLLQFADAALDEPCVRGRKSFIVMAGFGLWLAELIHPQARHAKRGIGSHMHGTAIGAVMATPGPVGHEQAFHQGRRKRGRRQQHAAAEQAGPMHQTG